MLRFIGQKSFPYYSWFGNFKNYTFNLPLGHRGLFLKRKLSGIRQGKILKWLVLAGVVEKELMQHCTCQEESDLGVTNGYSNTYKVSPFSL